MAIDPGIVEDVLNVMQLLDVQDSIVGNVERRGISGGQRKRVNIGLLPWTLGGSNGALEGRITVGAGPWEPPTRDYIIHDTL